MRIRLVGERPLLICNGEGADPLNPRVREISQVSQKKRKTDEDHELLSRLHFQSACYFDESIGVYLPSANAFKSIQEGAARFKEASVVKSQLIVKGVNGKNLEPAGSPILPDGRCTPDELYQKKEHVFRKVGKLNGRTSIVITRPIFNKWTVEFQLEFTEVTPARVVEYLKIAGSLKGVGTWRPVYGLYRVEVIK
jgi:hypothetical protein